MGEERSEAVPFYGPYFGEDDYKEKAETVIRPYIKERRKDGYFKAADGVKLHYVVLKSDDNRGSITVFHGKGEFFEKTEELMYELCRHGYNIFFLEMRGFGKSDRLSDDPEMVHVDSFDDYVSDQWEFFWKVVNKESDSKNRFIFSHSMGGLVASRFLEIHPQCYQAAVISSPMYAMKSGIPEWMVKFLAFTSHLFHRDKAFAPGQHDYVPFVFHPDKDGSRARFDAMLKYRAENDCFKTGGVSYGWVRTARIFSNKVLYDLESVSVPVLMCQAGRDETVDNEAELGFAGYMKDVLIVQFPESGHEIYLTTDKERMLYFDWILNFYEKNLR